MRNPPEPSVRDHDVGPSNAALLDGSCLRDVLATSNREDLFIGVEVTANHRIARIEEVAEGRHLASVVLRAAATERFGILAT